jgi:hypothetical protein
MTDDFDPIVAAGVLREIATEIRTAEGAARNGLFLELHRLHDTIFRLSLESHPDLPPELQGSAFNLEAPLPAPQVVRELNRLGSPLAGKEIRNLYKHMNMARNNMAHDSIIGRVTVSNSNVKRMVELAGLVATVLDPRGERAPLRPHRLNNTAPLSRARFYLLIGILSGAILTWGWGYSNNPYIAVGITIITAMVGGWAWMTGE